MKKIILRILRLLRKYGKDPDIQKELQNIAMSGVSKELEESFKGVALDTYKRAMNH